MDHDTLSIPATERLFSLFETKLHLLRELQALTLEQTALVSLHEMSALMTLLSRKQSIIEALQRIQSDLALYRNDDPERRVWNSPARRSECQTLVRQCEQLVAGLIVQENESIAEMSEQRENLNSQIQQNALATQVQQAYSSNVLSEMGSDGGFVMEG